MLVSGLPLQACEGVVTRSPHRRPSATLNAQPDGHSAVLSVPPSRSQIGVYAAVKVQAPAAEQTDAAAVKVHTAAAGENTQSPSGTAHAVESALRAQATAVDGVNTQSPPAAAHCVPSALSSHASPTPSAVPVHAAAEPEPSSTPEHVAGAPAAYPPPAAEQATESSFAGAHSATILVVHEAGSPPLAGVKVHAPAAVQVDRSALALAHALTIVVVHVFSLAASHSGTSVVVHVADSSPLAAVNVQSPAAVHVDSSAFAVAQLLSIVVRHVALISTAAPVHVIVVLGSQTQRSNSGL
jgi:hypothetical protein